MKIYNIITNGIRHKIIEHQKDVLKIWKEKFKNQKVIAEGNFTNCWLSIQKYHPESNEIEQIVNEKLEGNMKILIESEEK